MDLLLNILVPLFLALAIAGAVQPKLFVFWSPRKTRLQGFTGYLAAMLVVMTLPGFIEQGSWLTAVIMTGIVVFAPLFIASMIRPDDFVFWSRRRTRIKAAFVYLGGLVALVSLQTLTGDNAADNLFVWMFTPAVLSLIALAGAVFSPADVLPGDAANARRGKALAIYLPIALACVGATVFIAQLTPPDLVVERRDFNAEYDPGSPEGQLLARLAALETENDFPGLLREIRRLSSIYEYQAALDWLKNRTFAKIEEPRWALLYALAAYNYKDPDGVRALKDTAAQLQVLGMTVLRIDAARCVDEAAAMGKYRVWAGLDNELRDNLQARSGWERGDMTDAALNIEATIAERPATPWICNNNPSNILSTAEWQQHRKRLRARIDNGLLFKGGKS